MPKPQNPARKNTTILVSKVVKEKLRTCARPSETRKGYEKDEEVLDRILTEHIKTYQIVCEPTPTYPKSIN